MKFWENGFFENQNEDKSRIEISDEKWQQLLDGQSQGYEIYVDEQGEPALRERQISIEQSLEEEVYQLSEWFDEYDNQAKQYARAQRMGEQFDKNMASLDCEATVKAARMKVLKESLQILSE